MSKIKHGKKYRQLAEKVDPNKKYSLKEAFDFVCANPAAKFDESIDVAVNLGVSAEQSDQQVRSAVTLPHGVGKTARVCVFAKGEKAKEAEAAGADFVGSDDLVQKISGGWLEFDKAIATPDMMAAISKVAKVLGPRGLMPNPKLGTVTIDVAKAVKEQKQGKVEFRTDKAGIVHCLVGKRSFGSQKLAENFAVFFNTLVRLKPPTSKGVYIQRIHVSSTMGPALAVEPTEITQAND